MSIGVAVIAYNRPRYLEQVVRSIEANPEAETLPFHFFLDGGPDAALEANTEVIRQSTIRDARVVAGERNLGCPANTRACWPALPAVGWGVTQVGCS